MANSAYTDFRTLRGNNFIFLCRMINSYQPCSHVAELMEGWSTLVAAPSAPSAPSVTEERFTAPMTGRYSSPQEWRKFITPTSQGTQDMRDVRHIQGIQGIQKHPRCPRYPRPREWKTTNQPGPHPALPFLSWVRTLCPLALA